MSTCVEEEVCLFHIKGHCTRARFLRGQAKYFDNPKLATKGFREGGPAAFEQLVVETADNYIGKCQRPKELRAAARYARRKAARFFNQSR